MDRRPLIVVTGWLATTAAATIVGLVAVDMVGAGITGTAGGVRTEQEVARALAVPEATSAPAATPPGPVPATTGAGAGRRGFTTGGGSVVAECVPAGVRVLSWSPAPGYRTKEADRGPDEHVEVRFTGDGEEHEIRLRCRDSVPVSDPDD
ncbi:septum formation initiator [Micromonospora sp. NPDC005686]|uniref:septum formation initiator n=1 Tax=unclassified Micromonospora TaxID=2617518 RepID=UPI0033BA9521